MFRWTRRVLYLFRPLLPLRAAASIRMMHAIASGNVGGRYGGGRRLVPLGGMWWSWLSWSSDPLSSRTLADGVAAVLPSTVQIRVEMSTMALATDKLTL